jgi:CelD/BcsL family acetyltransferase involved in cellulose biosynthesis
MAAGEELALIEQSHAELPHTSVKGLDWEGYLAERSVKFRQRVGRGLERALKEDGISCSVRETSDPASLDADLGTLFRLHDLRHPGRESSIAESRTREALALFARSALERGWLRLRILELEGKPAAAALAWHIGPRYALYQGGFDPAWAERSAGMLMLNLTMRSAIEEGAEDVDLLLGSEPYKWRFAPEARRVRTVVLVRPVSPTRWLISSEAAARRYGRGLARRPKVGALARRLARFLPSDRSG